MPNDSHPLRRNAVGVAAVILAVATIANGLIAAFEFVRVRSSFARVQQSEEMIDHLADVMAAMRDAETGQRGFILVQRPEYLEPYRAARAVVHSRLERLASFDAGAAQQKRIDDLQSLVHLKLGELERTVAVAERSGFAAASSLVQSGEGKVIMDRLRKVAEDIEAYERARLNQRADDAEGMVKQALITTVLSTVTVAVLLAMTFLQFSRTSKAERLARVQAEVAREEAASLGRAKDQFIATVSHELRTPLTAILGWSRMLDDKDIDRDLLDEGLRAIRGCANAQKQLIEDLLDLSRIMTGKMRLQMGPIDLGEAARAGVNSVLPAAEAKSIRLEVASEESVKVNADFDRMQQVVWNLVSNAVKFTPKGGSVRVRVGRADSHATITVTDTGEGIDPEFAPHVFEPFRQADASKMRVHKGLGLGLAIVNQIVHLHGGTIAVESEGQGRGATFRATIPIMPFAGDVDEDEVVQAAPSESDAPVPLLPSRVALDGMSILVVDDHAATLDLISRVLRRSGAVVHSAGDSAAAMSIAQQKKIDFIVSDIGLVGESGVSLLQRLRAADLSFKPALALTAYAREEDRQRTLEGGFQAFLAKPVEPATLVATIAQVAGRS